MRTTTCWIHLAAMAAIGLVGHEAMAGDPMCNEIEKGDIAACTAKAAKTCTDGDDWARHVCQTRITPEFEQCGNAAFEKDAAAAQTILRLAEASNIDDMSATSDEEAYNRWAARVVKLETELAKYPRLQETWKACTSRTVEFVFGAPENLERLRGAVAAYKKALAQHVDFTLKSANEGMTAEGVDKADGKPGFEMNDYMKKKVEETIALEAKLPASWRYKEAELKASLVRSDKMKAAMGDYLKAQVAATSCPKGKNLEQPYLKIVKDEFDSDKNVKKRVIRHSAARYQSRDGDISRDNVPLVLCTQEAASKGSPEQCSYTNATVFREKPRGGSWTSWRLAVGSSEQFNCKKW